MYKENRKYNSKGSETYLSTISNTDTNMRNQSSARRWVYFFLLVREQEGASDQTSTHYHPPYSCPSVYITELQT
jgi:hypothetical protein